jgi:hypothetical protein
VEIMAWKSPYTLDEIITRAHSCVGKPVQDPRLFVHAYSCMPFLVEVFGWETPLKSDWIYSGTISQIAQSVGVPFIENGENSIGDVLVFNVHDLDHVALKVSDTTMIHAGFKTITEVFMMRYMEYYKGVIKTCLSCCQ